MTGARSRWLAVLAGLAIGASAMALAQAGGRDPDRARIEGIVREYILAHPEIIPEAIRKLQARETGKAIAAHRKDIETPFAGAWAGAADADVVLVEYFDYACGYCRKSNADVARLLKEDRRLKVVWRELPVLGPDSQAAAEASLAAASAGRFKPYHDALFAAGRPTATAIAAARRAAGVTGTLSASKVSAEITKNLTTAQAIGASGTPTFVVGDQILQGAVGYAALKQAIAEARQ